MFKNSWFIITSYIIFIEFYPTVVNKPPKKHCLYQIVRSNVVKINSLHCLIFLKQ